MCFAVSGDAIGSSWAHHTGDESMLVPAKFTLSPEDITWMSRCSCSQIVYLWLLLVHHQQWPQGKQKPRLRFGKQGGEKSISVVTCLRRVRPSCLRDASRQGWTHSPGYTGYDASLSRPS
jgi:hypothetical protein